MRLSRELAGMKWREMSMLLSGLDETTPLGKIVSIRSETDREALKNFTPAQHRIRNEWRRRKVKALPQKKVEKDMAALQATIASMFAPPQE